MNLPTNPIEEWYDSVECPDPIVYLTDDELEYLERRTFE